MFLKISQYLKGSTCVGVSALDFRSTTFLKRDSNTGVFLWILRNFLENLFWRTYANGCFCAQHMCTNSFRGALSVLRQFLATESPLKMIKDAFPFFTHLPNTSRNKGNQTIKFVQVIEYNLENKFIEKSFTKCGREPSFINQVVTP